jgi:hypothetical protein
MNKTSRISQLLFFYQNHPTPRWHFTNPTMID